MNEIIDRMVFSDQHELDVFGIVGETHRFRPMIDLYRQVLLVPLLEADHRKLHKKFFETAKHWEEYPASPFKWTMQAYPMRSF